MAGQQDDSQPGGTDTVPIDAVPDPVLGYERTADGAVIAVTNDAFDDAFDTASRGATVAGWLHSETTSAGERIEDVRSSLTADDRVDVGIKVRSDTDAVTPAEYRLRSLRGGGGSSAVDGYLLVTEREPNETIGAGHIASIISHDLRNPLDVANAHLRAARETGATEHFDEVRDSHERMEQIIQDVLELARGEQSLDMTAGVHIETVATKAWRSVDTEDASLRLADDLPTCQADSGRLQRLFENLFRNSVEHGSTGPASQARQDSVEHGRSGSGEKPDEQRDADTQLHVSVGSTPDGFFVADD